MLFEKKLRNFIAKTAILWYNLKRLSNKSNSSIAKCNQCGCDLIIQTSRTEKSERSFASTTIITYRCSNQSCQDEIDKKTAKRIELKNEQELARQKRLEQVIINKNASKV